MKTTVSLGGGAQNSFPGAGYGLGLLHLDLPACDKEYWSHDGGVFGFTSDNGVLPDGSRAASVVMTTQSIADGQFQADSTGRARALVQHALCG